MYVLSQVGDVTATRLCIPFQNFYCLSSTSIASRSIFFNRKKDQWPADLFFGICATVMGCRIFKGGLGANYGGDVGDCCAIFRS